jgi:hypothetical protein
MTICCSGEHGNSEVSECLKHVSKTGIIKSFLSSLPLLESLKFIFDELGQADPPGSSFPGRLEHVGVKNFVWRNLRMLEPGMLE